MFGSRILLPLGFWSVQMAQQYKGVNEGDDPDNEIEQHVRFRKEHDLIAEARATQHLFAHYLNNPFSRTCQHAKMIAPYAKSKAGQGRLEAGFGDHIVANYVILMKSSI